MRTITELAQRLQRRVLVADGAMGTLLSARRVPLPYENANLTDPRTVEEAHREYVEAGAELIETNTFGANRIKLAAYAMDSFCKDINVAGVRIARRVAGDGILVAGAMGPCGKALAPSGVVAPDAARQAFREQAEILLAEGVDLIILETFHDMDELRIAYETVHALADVPLIIQKVFVEDAQTIEAGLPERFAATVGSWEGVVALGANCAIGPQRMVQIVRAMAKQTNVPLSAMPTPGLPQRVGDEIRYAVTPEYFGRQASVLVEAGAAIIGGCCGTSAQHILAVARVVRDRGLRPRPHGPVTVAPPPVVEVQRAPLTEYSQFRRKIGKVYLRAVELDVPRGLDIQTVLDGAAALKQAGVDVIDISDGARARLRMNAMTVAHLVQERTGVEAMLHFACRDRNLLAVQADLLGAHALGIRNILAVTGDPALIGDYPSATSVYDIDSVGMVRILRRFNEGLDLAGAGIGGATAFTIAVAFDPLAANLNKEKDRLARKVDEGADIVYTQPIFDAAVLDVAAEACGKLGIPFLFGLLPLRSARHAEFMHNEVPGIRIPDPIRRRIAELEDKDARKYGLDVARQFLLDVRDRTQGVYVMPPFGNHKTAEAVLRVLD